MIVRLWKGRVPEAKAEAYLGLMRTVAIPDYRAIPGNRGASCLSRAEDGITEVWMLTFWDDIDAVRGFAGEPVDAAKYYDFDDDFLLEKAAKVTHLEVSGADGFAIPTIGAP